MSENEAHLSLTQCRALVHRPERTYYSMDHVRVMKDGVTETTNGKSLVRVYPKKSLGVKDEFFVSGKAVAKAGREAQRKTFRRKVPDPIVVDLDEGTLSYKTGSDLAVNLPGVIQDSDPAEKKRWPATDRVVDEYSQKKPSFQTFVAVEELCRILGVLKNSGCTGVRLDMFADKTKAIRFFAENDEAFVLGLIMPTNPGADLNEAKVPNYKKP